MAVIKIFIRRRFHLEKRSVWYHVLMLGIFLAFLSSCRALGTKPEVVSPDVVPPVYSTNTSFANKFHNLTGPVADEFLDNLLCQALEKNHDLQMARARIQAARSDLKRETALVRPKVNASFGGTARKNQTRNGKTSSSSSEEWNALLKGAYPLDIWGKSSARIQASQERFLGACEDEARIRLQLISDVAQTYVEILASRQKLALLQSQIQADQDLLDLIQSRFFSGLSSSLDISQQRATLARTQTKKPVLEKELSLALGKMAFLMGETRNTIPEIPERPFPRLLLLPSSGIPSELLENRGDIKAARHRLLASQWEENSARADLLPSFTLSAQALFSNGSLDLLFQNWVLSLGSSLAGTIFDGGEKKARIQKVQAVVKEQTHGYAKIVAQAIGEVEDCLVRLEKQKEYMDYLHRQKTALDAVLEAARAQYENGQANFLNYLSAWTSRQQLEQQMISETALYIKEHIRFYLVLGYDWKKEES